MYVGLFMRKCSSIQHDTIGAKKFSAKKIYVMVEIVYIELDRKSIKIFV